jgi:TorA maturation chaperone TorD
MARSEKENIFNLLAAVFAPPDQALLADLSQAWSLFPRTGKTTLETLQKDYDRLFANGGGKNISLIESTHKAWTADGNCRLPFAGQKGWVMGDSALHLQSILRALSLEVPPDFQGIPDHLVLELELLSYLYRSGSEDRILNFIEDHLDWIPELAAQIREAAPDSFYREAVERLDDFLSREKYSSKERKNGPARIH